MSGMTSAERDALLRALPYEDVATALDWGQPFTRATLLRWTTPGAYCPLPAWYGPPIGTGEEFDMAREIQEVSR